MKTNVTMVSKDRELFGVTIKQDTKTSFMSLTDLQEAYTRKRIEMGWNDKRIENILSNKDSSERIYYILKGKYLNDIDFDHFRDRVNDSSLIKVLKDMNLYVTKGRGANRSVMCAKEIWLMVAMDMNPMMYMECMNFMDPDIISSSSSNYIEHGGIFLEMCNILSSFNENDRIDAILEKINIVVTGNSNPGHYSIKDLSIIKEMQDDYKFLIEYGFVDSIDGIESILDGIIGKEYSNNSFCYTYIAFDNLSGETKIGKTFNIKKRESVMKTSNPRIKIIAFSKKDVEKEIHTLFEDKRLSGEWFNLTKEDIESILCKYDFKTI